MMRETFFKTSFRRPVMKTIQIIQQGDRWMAYFSDDQLLLPTPFSPRSRTKDEVKAKLQKINPDYIVSILKLTLLSLPKKLLAILALFGNNYQKENGKDLANSLYPARTRPAHCSSQ